MLFSVRSFLAAKYHAFNNSDNSFVLMTFCNLFTISYQIFEIISLSMAIISTGFDGQLGSVYLVTTRVLSFVMWGSLAVHRHDLKLMWIFLMGLQRRCADHRRRKHIRTINWIMLAFLVQELIPMTVWIIKGHTGSVVSFYENDTIEKLNSVFYPVTLFTLTFVFSYALIVGTSIIAALGLEFRMVGSDFEGMFDNLGSLEPSNEDSEHNWTTMENTFKRCALRHQILLGVTITLRDLLKTNSLIQLLTYFTMVAVGAFVYVFTQTSFGIGVVFFAFCVFATSVNLLLYGFVCDRLDDQMISIGHRVYSSGWPDKLIYSRAYARRFKDFRKMMLIVMERAQKSVEFTCGNFFVMSLITCRQVLWFAYSVFTVMISFLE
ncbi:hypothetical protein RP20_CCG012996 [Aedes albopictus]|nr:hypothetical protein RP20_CCG012996 [Aedes albopictus]